jgi:ABC-type uncharacterized transport system substrate-binding protein
MAARTEDPAAPPPVHRAESAGSCSRRLAFAALNVDVEFGGWRVHQPDFNDDPPQCPGGKNMRMNTIAQRVLLLGLLLPATPALAHPHVWVTTKAELVFGADGKVTAVHHRWTFDPAYSAVATQGLDKNNDGKLTTDELQELAKVNTESLHELDYFTVLKANGAKQAFNPPSNPEMTFENGAVTLSFRLPLKTPARNKLLALEVYDPTFFVAFGIAEGDDAMTLVNAPQGCGKTITRPKPIETAQQQKLSEAFFEALTAAATLSATQASRVIVACP